MSKKKYSILEYQGEIIDAATQEEAIKVARQRIQDRNVEVDEKNTCQVEDKDVLKEIELDEKRATKKKPKLPLNKKN